MMPALTTAVPFPKVIVLLLVLALRQLGAIDPLHSCVTWTNLSSICTRTHDQSFQFQEADKLFFCAVNTSGLLTTWTLTISFFDNCVLQARSAQEVWYCNGAAKDIVAYLGVLGWLNQDSRHTPLDEWEKQLSRRGGLRLPPGTLWAVSPPQLAWLGVQRAAADVSLSAPSHQYLGWANVDKDLRSWAVYNGDTIGLPYDLGHLLLFFRRDALQAVGLTVPETWDDLLAAAEKLNVTQRECLEAAEADATSTASGAPGCYGRGFCLLLPPGCNNDGTLLAAVWASMVALEGPEAGLYFSAEGMVPRLGGQAMVEAVAVFRELVRLGSPGQPCSRLDWFTARASCALGLADSGAVRLLGLAPQWEGAAGGNSSNKGNSNASIGGRMLSKISSSSDRKSSSSWQGWGQTGTAPLPGSTRVEDPTSDSMSECRPDLCPFAEPHSSGLSSTGDGNSSSSAGSNETQLVNRAPHPGRGPYFFAMNNVQSTNLTQQYAIWRALTAALAPAASWARVTDPTIFSSPVRTDHLSPGALPAWEAAGWNRADAADYLEALRYSLDHPNAVPPLRFLGGEVISELLGGAAAAAVAQPDLKPENITQGLMANLTAAFPDGFLFIQKSYLECIGARGKAHLGIRGPGSATSQSPAGNSGGRELVLRDRMGIAFGVCAVVVLLVASALFKRHTLLLGAQGSWRKRRRGRAGAPIPGYGQETTLIVTDIQDSTQLWEALPPIVMDLSLNIHNHCVRQLVRRYQGYETHTEGDSFTLAFHTAVEAASFALELQMALMDSDWPAMLLDHPSAAEVFLTTKASAAAAAAGVAHATVATPPLSRPVSDASPRTTPPSQRLLSLNTGPVSCDLDCVGGGSSRGAGGGSDQLIVLTTAPAAVTGGPRQLLPPSKGPLLLPGRAASGSALAQKLGFSGTGRAGGSSLVRGGRQGDIVAPRLPASFSLSAAPSPIRREKQLLEQLAQRGSCSLREPALALALARQGGVTAGAEVEVPGGGGGGGGALFGGFTAPERGWQLQFRMQGHSLTMQRLLSSSRAAIALQRDPAASSGSDGVRPAGGGRHIEGSLNPDISEAEMVRLRSARALTVTAYRHGGSVSARGPVTGAGALAASASFHPSMPILPLQINGANSSFSGRSSPPLPNGNVRAASANVLNLRGRPPAPAGPNLSSQRLLYPVRCLSQRRRSGRALPVSGRAASLTLSCRDSSSNVILPARGNSVLVTTGRSMSRFALSAYKGAAAAAVSQSLPRLPGLQQRLQLAASRQGEAASDAAEDSAASGNGANGDVMKGAVLAVAAAAGGVPGGPGRRWLGSGDWDKGGSGRKGRSRENTIYGGRRAGSSHGLAVSHAKLLRGEAGSSSTGARLRHGADGVEGGGSLEVTVKDLARQKSDAKTGGEALDAWEMASAGAGQAAAKAMEHVSGYTADDIGLDPKASANGQHVSPATGRREQLALEMGKLVDRIGSFARTSPLSSSSSTGGNNAARRGVSLTIPAMSSHACRDPIDSNGSSSRRTNSLVAEAEAVVEMNDDDIGDDALVSYVPYLSTSTAGVLATSATLQRSDPAISETTAAAFTTVAVMEAAALSPGDTDDPRLPAHTNAPDSTVSPYITFCSASHPHGANAASDAVEGPLETLTGVSGVAPTRHGSHSCSAGISPPAARFQGGQGAGLSTAEAPGTLADLDCPGEEIFAMKLQEDTRPFYEEDAAGCCTDTGVHMSCPLMGPEDAAGAGLETQLRLITPRVLPHALPDSGLTQGFSQSTAECSGGAAVTSRRQRNRNRSSQSDVFGGSIRHISRVVSESLSYARLALTGGGAGPASGLHPGQMPPVQTHGSLTTGASLLQAGDFPDIREGEEEYEGEFEAVGKSGALFEPPASQHSARLAAAGPGAAEGGATGGRLGRGPASGKATDRTSNQPTSRRGFRKGNSKGPHPQAARSFATALLYETLRAASTNALGVGLAVAHQSEHLWSPAFQQQYQRQQQQQQQQHPPDERHQQPLEMPPQRGASSGFWSWASRPSGYLTSLVAAAGGAFLSQQQQYMVHDQARLGSGILGRAVLEPSCSATMLSGDVPPDSSLPQIGGMVEVDGGVGRAVHTSRALMAQASRPSVRSDRTPLHFPSQPPPSWGSYRRMGASAAVSAGLSMYGNADSGQTPDSGVDGANVSPSLSCTPLQQQLLQQHDLLCPPPSQPGPNSESQWHLGNERQPGSPLPPVPSRPLYGPQGDLCNPKPDGIAPSGVGALRQVDGGEAEGGPTTLTDLFTAPDVDLQPLQVMSAVNLGTTIPVQHPDGGPTETPTAAPQRGRGRTCGITSSATGAGMSAPQRYGRIASGVLVRLATGSRRRMASQSSGRGGASSRRAGEHGEAGGGGGAGHQVLLFRGFRVRVGLHSGLDEASDVFWTKRSGRRAYSGPAMRLARLLSDAALGGMVVLSRATLELLRPLPNEQLPAGTLVWHCGRFRLGDKDGTATLDVYQALLPALLPRLQAFHGVPLRVVAALMPGLMEAPVGPVALATCQVVGVEALRSWDLAVTEEALEMFRWQAAQVVATHGGTMVELECGGAVAAFTETGPSVASLLTLEDTLKTAVPWPAVLLEHELGEEICCALPSERDGVVVTQLVHCGPRVRCAAEWFSDVRVDLTVTRAVQLYRNASSGKPWKNLQRMLRQAKMGQTLISGSLQRVLVGSGSPLLAHIQLELLGPGPAAGGGHVTGARPGAKGGLTTGAATATAASTITGIAPSSAAPGPASARRRGKGAATHDGFIPRSQPCSPMQQPSSARLSRQRSAEYGTLVAALREGLKQPREGGPAVPDSDVGGIAVSQSLRRMRRSGSLEAGPDCPASAVTPASGPELAVQGSEGAGPWDWGTERRVPEDRAIEAAAAPAAAGPSAVTSAVAGRRDGRGSRVLTIAAALFSGMSAGSVRGGTSASALNSSNLSDGSDVDHWPHRIRAAAGAAGPPGETPSQVLSRRSVQMGSGYGAGASSNIAAVLRSHLAPGGAAPLVLVPESAEAHCNPAESLYKSGAGRNVQRPNPSPQPLTAINTDLLESPCGGAAALHDSSAVVAAAVRMLQPTASGKVANGVASAGCGNGPSGGLVLMPDGDIEISPRNSRSTDPRVSTSTVHTSVPLSHRMSTGEVSSRVGSIVMAYGAARQLCASGGDMMVVGSSLGSVGSGASSNVFLHNQRRGLPHVPHVGRPERRSDEGQGSGSVAMMAGDWANCGSSRTVLAGAGDSTHRRFAPSHPAVTLLSQPAQRRSCADAGAPDAATPPACVTVPSQQQRQRLRPPPGRDSLRYSSVPLPQPAPGQADSQVAYPEAHAPLEGQRELTAAVVAPPPLQQLTPPSFPSAAVLPVSPPLSPSGAPQPLLHSRFRPSGFQRGSQADQGQLRSCFTAPAEAVLEQQSEPLVRLPQLPTQPAERPKQQHAPLVPLAQHAATTGSLRSSPADRASPRWPVDLAHPSYPAATAFQKRPQPAPRDAAFATAAALGDRAGTVAPVAVRIGASAAAGSLLRQHGDAQPRSAPAPVPANKQLASGSPSGRMPEAAPSPFAIAGLAAAVKAEMQPEEEIVPAPDDRGPPSSQLSDVCMSYNPLFCGQPSPGPEVAGGGDCGGEGRVMQPQWRRQQQQQQQQPQSQSHVTTAVQPRITDVRELGRGPVPETAGAGDRGDSGRVGDGDADTHGLWPRPPPALRLRRPDVVGASQSAVMVGGHYSLPPAPWLSGQMDASTFALPYVDSDYTMPALATAGALGPFGQLRTEEQASDRTSRTALRGLLHGSEPAGSHPGGGTGRSARLSISNRLLSPELGLGRGLGGDRERGAVYVCRWRWVVGPGGDERQPT